MTKRIIGVFSIFVAVWLVAPLVVVVMSSFNEASSFNFPPDNYSTRWYQNFFDNAPWVHSFWNSTKVAIVSALSATVLGTMASLSLQKSSKGSKNFFISLFVSPLIVPHILIGVGIYMVFLRIGILGSFFGFVLAHTVISIPLVMINVLAALTTFDSKLEMAAYSLGANGFDVFRTVTFPLIFPGILSGFILAFINSFDEIIISLFIQSPFLQTLPVKMFQSVTYDSDPTVAAAAVLMMGISIILAGVAFIFQAQKNK